MEEAITYAELQFVKSPLKRNVSYPGQESDKDEELSYENVQVPSAPEAPRDLAPGDQAGHVHSCSSQYLLLGLLLTCLLLGVAAIYLGVHYLQVSHQFGQLSRLLEASNVSLQEQLHLGNVQLEQMEKDLQISKEQLAQSQRALEEEQKAHQVLQEELRDCQAKMQGTLQSVQKLRYLQVILRPFFTCPSQDTCCMVGWILIQGRCFHISLTKRDWQRSREYCESLPSGLTTVRDNPSSYYYSESSPWKRLLSKLSRDTSYWVGHSLITEYWKRNTGCSMLEHNWSWVLKSMECTTLYACICEMASFRFPDVYLSV